MSGARKAMREAEEGYYAQLVKQLLSDVTSPEGSHLTAIEKDIDRTFLDGSQSKVNKSALYRLLACFSIHAPHVGYCQSMNVIAAFILEVFSSKEEEEKAFWVLVQVRRVSSSSKCSRALGLSPLTYFLLHVLPVLQLRFARIYSPSITPRR
jgi:hypothetical protein